MSQSPYPLNGHDYLTRYRRDPVTGEQRSTSLGRRSAETELMHRQFFEGRARLDEQLAALKPKLATQARMAKALRLTRTPSAIADVLRAIANMGLAPRTAARRIRERAARLAITG